MAQHRIAAGSLPLICHGVASARNRCRSAYRGPLLRRPALRGAGYCLPAERRLPSPCHANRHNQCSAEGDSNRATRRDPIAVGRVVGRGWSGVGRKGPRPGRRGHPRLVDGRPGTVRRRQHRRPAPVGAGRRVLPVLEGRGAVAVGGPCRGAARYLPPEAEVISALVLPRTYDHLPTRFEPVTTCLGRLSRLAHSYWLGRRVAWVQDSLSVSPPEVGPPLPVCPGV